MKEIKIVLGLFASIVALFTIGYALYAYFTGDMETAIFFLVFTVLLGQVGVR